MCNHLSLLASEIYRAVCEEHDQPLEEMYPSEIPASWYDAQMEAFNQKLEDIYARYDITREEFVHRLKERGMEGHHIYNLFRGEV